MTGDPADVAELLLSELVTNAYQHADAPGRDIEVRVTVEPRRLLLEVSDAGGGRPHPYPAGQDDDHGRGLLLLDALADTWGVAPRACGVGKTVWATIALPQPTRDGAPPPPTPDGPGFDRLITDSVPEPVQPTGPADTADIRPRPHPPC